MSTTPRVTFLLPTRNAAATVAATVDSILTQNMADWELLVLDAASTDQTLAVVGRYRDARIRVVASAFRQPLAESLNRGMAMARADYIARIDADDLCLPHRAGVQADFLDAHADIAVVGSQCEMFTDERATEQGEVYQIPFDPAAVAATLLLRNVIAHPSVMMRKPALAAHGLAYDESLAHAEDYDLWARCAMADLGLANMSDVLLRYRVHAGQLTQRNAANDSAAAAAVRKRLIARLSLRPDAETLAIHEAIASDRFLTDAAFISDAAHWLTILAQANERRKLFDHPALMRLLTGRHVSLSRFARKNFLPTPDIEATPFAAYLFPGVLV
jgi:glycosyltransferase involved in cell wall biosynthesis